uniref:Uncharacterized protein n=1 Tax=Panagrolaimus superbus TaxID=310955 RepID=A0A914Y759_9BILA
MFMDDEEKDFVKPQKAINALEFPGKPPIIANLKEGNPETNQSKTKQRKEIDSLFDLDEDPEKPAEKYGDDIDISDDDGNDDDEDENETEGTYNSSKGVPHSLPMNINFGIDQLNRRRGPIEKEPKSVKASIPTGSIYENMQILSRSIQSADYRNRFVGTKPDDASDTVGYSQSYQTHGYTRPRTIFCQQPAQRVNISEETLEESSAASLETPK